MTQVTEPVVAQKTRRSAPPGYGRTGRWPVVIALIISLIGCGLTRQWAQNWKQAQAGFEPLAGEHGALSGMDSYALALMLGGLRGPLVMVLWSKVESQKIDRDLEDVDSMIEWIRLLQPEFDTVHIFQIWNKAYNISVLMASTASKYTTILDAVDYARRVEADRPDDLNINDSLSQVMSEKLDGKSTSEREFYRKQFREDSMTDANRRAAYPQDNNYRRLGFKFLSDTNGPLLDDHNNLLGQLIAPRLTRPADLPASSEWNDGSELQYLKPYQPFPYGITPAAMGYNYSKRAQVAMTVGGQRPLQVSDTVIDSRPGLLLKQWAEEESDSGVKFEAAAFGEKSTADPHELELTTAQASTSSPPQQHDLDAAIYSYGLSSRLCSDALKEYERHLANTDYVNPYQTYTSHLDELRALREMSAADHAYLTAMKDKADSARWTAEARDKYLLARSAYQKMVLKYFLEEAVAQRLFGNTPPDWDKVNSEQMDGLYRGMLAILATLPPNQRVNDDHRADYAAYIERAAARLAALGPAPRSILEAH